MADPKPAEGASPVDSAPADAPDAGAARGWRRGRWRRPVVVLLLVLGSLLALLSVTAVWVNRILVDTDGYLSTVGPLADNPAIQNAMATRLSDQLLNSVDVQGVVSGILPQQAHALAGPITSGVDSFVQQAAQKLVTSPKFRTAWIAANRGAHDAVVAVLLGRGRAKGTLSVKNGTVSLDLSAVFNQLKASLDARGVTFLDKVPPGKVSGMIVLFQSKRLAKAQTATRLLNRLAVWLPIIGLVLLALAIWLSPDHRRTLLWATFGVALAVILLGAALSLGRAVYLNAISSSIQSPPAAGAAFDIVVKTLRTIIRTVLLVAVLVALGAWLAGPSRVAIRLRALVTRGTGRAAAGTESAGLSLGPIGRGAAQYRRGLEVTAVILAGLVLVFWNRPTPVVVLGIAIVLVVALLLIEFLARLGPHPAVTTAVEPEAHS